MEWYGMVWHGMAGMVWYGMVWYGMVRKRDVLMYFHRASVPFDY